MAGASLMRGAGADEPARRLLARITAFLLDQRLDPDPANYAFAYHLLTNPDGALARAVAALTDGGVRLTRRDIEALDGDVRPSIAPKAAAQKTDGLVAQTQMQVEGFADIVTAIRMETEGFGRDLVASAEAMTRTAPGDIGDIAQITAAMIARVHSAEEKLDSATREASELRKKLEEARDNARRDPLTDLPNRRAFEEAYSAQVPDDAQLCVAVCDIDHFKLVNDRFGHAVGDRVLKVIAHALADACKGHLVARYGGEEFAILFAGITPEQARATLDSARAIVAAKHYRLREDDAPLGEVTFSAGITIAAPGDSYHAAFQRADRLLYSAKAEGRNCVRWDFGNAAH